MLNYIDASEIKLSERLDISYQDVKFKPLISLDVDPVVKKELLSGKLNYGYDINLLENDFSKLLIKVSNNKLKYEFIFKKTKMISKPSYYAEDWECVNSKYFVFHTSSRSLLNQYSISRLDSFVEHMLEVLQCGTDEIQKLQKEKIHYYLCKDESEIQKLTGYSARGLYYLSSDIIISTFNCHYHELCHLLINYKIKSNRLYTLPLLQEGFAVAFGGRGGKEPNVILNRGNFYQRITFWTSKNC